MTATATFVTPPPGEHDDDVPPRFTVGVTGTGLSDGYLCLLYAITPVPAALADDRVFHEGVDVALAIDQQHRLYRSGRCAYRTSADGTRVVGALRIGPARWRGRGSVRVLFPPFACTPGLEEVLCEVRVMVDSERAHATAITRL